MFWSVVFWSVIFWSVVFWFVVLSSQIFRHIFMNGPQLPLSRFFFLVSIIVLSFFAFLFEAPQTDRIRNRLRAYPPRSTARATRQLHPGLITFRQHHPCLHPRRRPRSAECRRGGAGSPLGTQRHFPTCAPSMSAKGVSGLPTAVKVL